MRFNPVHLVALVALLQTDFSVGANEVYNYNITASIRDLTTAQGIPNLPLTLSRLRGDDWIIVSKGKTEANGQLDFTSTKYKYARGTYKLRYDVRNHYNVTFYPFVDITFVVSSLLKRYAFPVLLDEYGYGTYLGVFN
ncbi:probable 5-hydroxyisourate hydrolase R09H10.3 isoform X2 [Nasonia vitripennis]|uniref:Transthyretin/hydroxyisourate hydrolase domain-containing protein n=1 Tax=Nasonia vitripennis TaxID=7425 RepID=A0A7M7LS64_NASVI|nr:probable 5-hydroxyisourate hydrolase R09H10.3 isoform X2 [Nasonia vitripennis]